MAGEGDELDVRGWLSAILHDNSAHSSVSGVELVTREGERVKGVLAGLGGDVAVLSSPSGERCVAVS